MRHFLISYRAQLPNGSQVFGNMTSGNRSDFPNHVELLAFMADSASAPLDSVVITGIFEFQSDKDFEDFCRGRD
jgi:hypothetical protein